MITQYSRSVLCDAPADVVYELVTRTSEWPGLFEGRLSATSIQSDADGRLLEVSARSGDRLISWQWHVRLLPEVLGVEAEVRAPLSVFASMRTSVRVFRINSEQSLLLVEHEYELSATPGDGGASPDTAGASISTAIDSESRI